MTFILPTNVLGIQNEMKHYRQLCLQYDYTPAQKEYEDIVRFILLFSGDGISESVLNESSSTLDYLYESFIEDLEEAHSEVDGEAEWDTAAGATINTTKNIVKGLAVGAALTGIYIAFLFKKGKIKSSLEQERKLELEKLKGFKKVVSLQVKLAELENKEIPELGNIIPSMTPPSTELEKPSAPSLNSEK
jgi:hypothetical protein